MLFSTFSSVSPKVKLVSINSPEEKLYSPPMPNPTSKRFIGLGLCDSLSILVFMLNRYPKETPTLACRAGVRLYLSHVGKFN